MTRRARAFALSLLVTASIASSFGARDARADEATESRKKEAQAFFEEGLRLAKGNDPRGALTAFREAYARFPSFRVLYNIGQLCARTGDGGCAVRSYERYLRDGDKEVPAKRRKEVEAEIRQLSRTLGRLTVTTSVTGAEVFVDDEPVGRTPMSDAVALSGGQHKISATAPDLARAEKSVSIVAGQTSSVDLVLEKKEKEKEPVAETPSASPAAPEPTTATDKPKGEPAPFPVVPWAVTGGFAAATLVTGLLAANAYGDYKDTRDGFPITRDELDSAHGTARDLFLVTTAFGVATLVSAGVATYFTLGGKTPEPGKEKKSVALVPTLGGLVVTGGFP